MLGKLLKAPPFVRNVFSLKKLEMGLLPLITSQLKEFYIFYIWAVFCLFMTHYIQSHLPFMAKELADMVVKDFNKIDTYNFFLVAFGIIIFRTFSRLLFFYPARVTERNMRVELLSKIEQTIPARYRHLTSGEIFQVLYGDMEQMRALLGFALLQVGNVLVALVVLTPQIARFNSNLLIALIPLVVSFILFTFIVGKTRKFQKAALDSQAEVQNIIMETYSGKSTIKNYHAEKSFVNLFGRKSLKELWNFYRGGIGISFSIPMIPLGIGISLLWGGHIVRVEDLGANSLIVFSGFVFLFLEPLAYISWIGVVLASSYAAWQRISGFLKDLNKTSGFEKDIELLNYYNEGEIYTYNVKFWKKEIKLFFPEHKISVLVGATGCGKSEVLLQVAEILRCQNISLSFVAQTPYIYNDSLKNNIFLGNIPTEKYLKKCRELLDIFELNILDENFERLLNLEVGEHGKKLSGGQGKRLCLVRSLLSDVDYLLWDDPFSSVDLVLEKKIMDKIFELGVLKHKTLILTSHRLSSVKNSDRVIFIKKQEGVIEEGEAASLLQSNSKIKHFFSEQKVLG